MPRSGAPLPIQHRAGLALSAVFVGLLLWLNVANLWHLVSTSPIGWVAVAMLLVFNTLVFSGVQFAIAVMRMAAPEGTAGGTARRSPRSARSG